MIEHRKDVMRTWLDKWSSSVAVGLTIAAIVSLFGMWATVNEMKVEFRNFSDEIRAQHIAFNALHSAQSKDIKEFREEQLRRTDEIEWVHEYRNNREWKPGQ